MKDQVVQASNSKDEALQASHSPTDDATDTTTVGSTLVLSCHSVLASFWKPTNTQVAFYVVQHAALSMPRCLDFCVNQTGGRISVNL